MILKRISILHYKNIREATLQFSPKMNCFIGHNGEGKTNLLDAVYYLSFCRSANNAVDSQLINHEQDFFVVEGEYGNDFSEKSTAEADENRLNIYCGMKRGTKKHFKRDGKAYSRLSDHIGLIPVVFVSPADTLLIDGVSEDRRRLMDMVISQYDRSYIELLSGYNKALQQRNALLRMEQEPDLAVLEIWEQQMAVNGEKLYEKRRAFVDELIPIFQRIYQQIAAGKEQVSLRYVSHCERGPLLDVIQRDRAKDRVVGYSLHGVHRDDLEMLIDGYPVRREGSQGQHKTFVIALKLAQFDFLKRTVSATTPLLLLDDIFDKLDAQRVERIVRLVSDDGYGQIFITDTNRQHLDQILSSGTTDYKLFRVDKGVISEQIP